MAVTSRKSMFACAFVAFTALHLSSLTLISQQPAEKATPVPAAAASSRAYLDPLEDPIVMRPKGAPVAAAPIPASQPAVCKGKACRPARQSRKEKTLR